MLRLARLRGAPLPGAGSFKPRKLGPLMEDEPSATGRGGSLGGPATALVAVGAAATETDWGSAGLAGGVANSDPPHMPQKRFCSEFSLPQRLQRKNLLHL